MRPTEKRASALPQTSPTASNTDTFHGGEREIGIMHSKLFSQRSIFFISIENGKGISMIEYQDKRLQQLNTLIEMTALINSTLDTFLIRKKVIEAATKLLNAEAGSLLIVNHKTGELFFEVAIGGKSEKLTTITLEKGVGIAGWVAEHGEPVISNDVGSDARFFRGVDEVSGFITKSMICVPVRTKERIVGVLQVINRIEGGFGFDDMVLLYAFANQVAVAIENARLYQESVTDGLTGLYHHKYFELRLKEEMDRSKRYKHPLTLLLLDIDFFKKVNDTCGHLAGDMVLRGIAQILKDGTRLSDVAARYGGEEFAVILPNISYENALNVAERLRKTTEQMSFENIRITISSGIGYFDGESPDAGHKELVELADRALYNAKNNGRNRVESMILRQRENSEDAKKRR
ncbi:MAG: sensor domain-containing diguanylate cyclase [Nitrospirae bacterium]|nr:MAG: sensor domain-containing diguanylate cyclase [Nitrospirota bacterium]